MEEFSCKTTIYSGAGAISALAGMKAQRLMLELFRHHIYALPQFLFACKDRMKTH